MARSTVYLVSDDKDFIERVKAFGMSQGVQVRVYSSGEWSRGLQDTAFRSTLVGEVPSLASGSNPLEEGAKILQFPGSQAQADANAKVRTINELESIAIENAIYEYGGNLTEAAKALGIGRATLYRKVKQYNIDPSGARKKRAA